MEYVIFIICLIIPLWLSRYAKTGKRAQLVARGHVKRKNGVNGGVTEEMLKLVETLVGKTCAISTVDSGYEGTILGVEDGWIVLNDKWSGTRVIVNPEYVVGISEIRVKPKKKKGVPVQEEVAAAQAPDNDSLNAL